MDLKRRNEIEVLNGHLYNCQVELNGIISSLEEDLKVEENTDVKKCLTFQLNKLRDADCTVSVAVSETDIRKLLYSNEE